MLIFAYGGRRYEQDELARGEICPQVVVAFDKSSGEQAAATRSDYIVEQEVQVDYFWRPRPNSVVPMADLEECIRIVVAGPRENRLHLGDADRSASRIVLHLDSDFAVVTEAGVSPVPQSQGIGCQYGEGYVLFEASKVLTPSSKHVVVRIFVVPFGCCTTGCFTPTSLQGTHMRSKAGKTDPSEQRQRDKLGEERHTSMSRNPCREAIRDRTGYFGRGG